MIKILLVFILVAFSNFLWTKYITHIAKVNPVAASIYGTAIALTGNLVTLIYVNDHWMIIPSALATLISTYFSVKFSKKN